MTAAISSISGHLEAGFLTSEKILLGGKVSSDTPGYPKLRWLFDRDTPLDEIFQRMVIPVLIAYDCSHCASFAGDDSYNEKLLDDISKFQARFSAKLPSNLSIFCFYFPMDSKEKLIEAFDKKLGAYI